MAMKKTAFYLVLSAFFAFWLRGTPGQCIYPKDFADEVGGIVVFDSASFCD